MSQQHFQYSISEKKYEDLIPTAVIKKHLGISEKDLEAEEILKTIKEYAIDAAESFLGCCIVEQTVSCKIKNLAQNHIKLPVAFVKEFKSYTIEDQDTQITKNLMDYYDQKNNTLFLKCAPSKSTIEIQYIAQWHRGEVPSDIKLGILQHVRNIYDDQSPSLMQNKDSIDLYQTYRRLML